MDSAAVTAGFLLDGRVRYAQPREGFRSGIEPVLLAAAVPARRGDRVLEGGCGAGAALLCLAHRVPGIAGLGIEHDPALAALAAANAAANGADGLRFEAADLLAWAQDAAFDHALANPPYHAPEGTRSSLPSRESAKRAPAGLLQDWAAALSRPLRHRGTLTLILTAASLAEALAAMRAAGCQPGAVLPLWPKAGRAAKLILVQGVKGGRAPLRLLPGLVLHAADGAFTPEADAVLRGGAGLPL